MFKVLFTVAACCIGATAAAGGGVKSSFSGRDVMSGTRQRTAVDTTTTWALAWSDEFNGKALNMSVWNPKTGIHVPSEGEYYLPSQVYVEDGCLVLRSDRKDYAGHSYVSGWVDSQNKWFANHGRWEIRAKLPMGLGMWPAHWLMPQDGPCWPMGGEIDIMEALGGSTPNGGGGGPHPHQVHGALHWSLEKCGDATEMNGGDWSPVYPFSFADDFHTFGVVWNNESISYYVDDWTTPYTSVSNPAEKFEQRDFYWILNSAVGGTWGGFPVASTPFPQFHYIDYVRFYVPQSSA